MRHKKHGWIHRPRILLFQAFSPDPTMQPDLSNNVNLRDAKFGLRSAWTGVASEIWKTFWIVRALSLSQCILKWNPVLAKQPADSLVCAPAASQGPKKILAILQESLWLVACFGCFLSMAQEDPQRATWGPAGRIEITPRQFRPGGYWHHVAMIYYNNYLLHSRKDFRTIPISAAIVCN